MDIAKMMGSKNGISVDVESLKSLVEPNNTKIIPEEKGVLKGSVKLFPTERRKRGSSFRQVFSSLSANLGTINTGMAFGFSAVSIPQLLKGDGFIKIDEDQASWIASLSSVTTPVGCIFSGYLMDAIGRRRTLIITQLPMIMGWLLIASATQVEMIYAGRLLVGLGSGMVGAPARVYTSEVTQPHLRGMLAAMASVGVSLGVTLEYLIGALYSWPVLALASSIIPMIALLASFFLPESPSWLLSHGQVEECSASLVRLRGPTCDVEEELQDLISFSQRNNLDHLLSVKEKVQAILHPSALKPFIILSLYFIIYQFSGVNPVTFYAVEVFQDSGAEMNKYLATVLLGIVRLCFTVVACIIMRKSGRRPLTFISSIFCGLSMVALGTYMFAFKSVLTWLPVVFIFIFIAASTIGYLVVPWVMIGEVYPTKVRGIIGGMTTCVAHFSIFLVVKTYPSLQHLISKHGVFWSYGTVSLLGTIFFYFCLPETKGRTLQEIEDYFSGRIKSLKPQKNINNNKPSVLVAKKGDILP
ncbi:facilitated trehalose transporter Tret1-like [Lycorma delicatula]|uniref:facilitated trehalose transporter Tret1-like n=1 Tax=Lycorma delicatula TaxID=130591 RepID=UPI003F5112C0